MTLSGLLNKKVTLQVILTSISGTCSVRFLSPALKVSIETSQPGNKLDAVTSSLMYGEIGTPGRENARARPSIGF